MEKIKLSVLLTCLSFVLVLPFPVSGQDSEEDGKKAPSLPKYEEIFDLIRTRLPEISEQDLQHAALQGILTEFQSLIELESGVSNEEKSEPVKASIAKKEILAENIAYIRLHVISQGLGDLLREEIESLKIEKGARGLVLDLRYAYGSDYNEVLKLAGIFLDEAKELLNWGAGNQKAIIESPTIKLPLVVLINESTKGAAEALVGAFDLTEIGAIIGRPTAGVAVMREHLPLSSGHLLTIATQKVKLADGTDLAVSGVTPDILVDVTPAAQAAHFDDPYGKLSSTQKTNSTERLNEAALMRRQNDANGDVEIDINVPPSNETESNEKPTTIMDPILARGVDLLKGWTIFNKSGK